MSDTDNAANGETMQVFLTSTSETGFADYVELPLGGTLGDLWNAKFEGKDPKNFVIRVERAPGDTLARSFVMQDGDRVTVTPHKFEGAEQLGFRD
jgi:hypothetical protein